MILLEDIHKVAVGSTNPVKIQAVQETLAYYMEHPFTVTGYPAMSGVSDMPMTEEETRIGSFNRAKRCLEQGGYDFAVGLEGGVSFSSGDDCYLFGCVTCIDTTGYFHTCTGTQFLLPPAMGVRVKHGEELGPLMDEFLGQKDTKKQGGVIGFLTRDKLPRKESFMEIVTHTLIPRLHPALYTA